MRYLKNFRKSFIKINNLEGIVKQLAPLLNAFLGQKFEVIKINLIIFF